MAFVVKQADVFKDKALILDILMRNREKANYPFDKRYDWLYQQNPHGAAVPWIIWDDKTGTPAGTTAVFPRKMLVHNKEMLCWNCGDFSIDAKYRALGVAVKLRKEAKHNVDAGTVPFLYAHPNNRMAQVHLRAGHKQIGLMKRFALPIRFSRYLGPTVASKVFAATVEVPITAVLKSKYRKLGDYENIPRDAMRFNGVYRELCEEVNAAFPVLGLRDEDYLDWKFRQHPITTYNLFNYYESGKLAGFIVYWNVKRTVGLQEILCKADSRVQHNLIATFIHFLLAEEKQAGAITTILEEHNPFIEALLANGFKYRADADSPVISYTADPALESTIHNGRNWFITLGDRDA